MSVAVLRKVIQIPLLKLQRLAHPAPSKRKVATDISPGIMQSPNKTHTQTHIYPNIYIFGNALSHFMWLLSAPSLFHLQG